MKSAGAFLISRMSTHRAVHTREKLLHPKSIEQIQLQRLDQMREIQLARIRTDNNIEIGEGVSKLLTTG
jgi:hypothetical protein